MSSSGQDDGDGLNLGLSDILASAQSERVESGAHGFVDPSFDIATAQSDEGSLDPIASIVKYIEDRKFEQAEIEIAKVEGSAVGSDLLVLRSIVSLERGALSPQIVFSEMHERLVVDNRSESVSPSVRSLEQKAWKILHSKLLEAGESSMAHSAAQLLGDQVSSSTDTFNPRLDNRGAGVESLRDRKPSRRLTEISRALLLISLGIILVFLAWFELRPLLDLVIPPKVFSIAPVRFDDVSVVAQKIPQVPDVSPPSIMDGLAFDLDNVVAIPVEAEKHTNLSRSPAKSSDGTNPVNSSVESSSRKVESKGKEPVPLDLSGPKEPENVRVALSQKRDPKEDKTATILFGGPKPDVTIGTLSSEQRRLGVPVEKFSERRIFRVLVKSDIRSQPDIRSRFIATLEPGDRVSSDTRIGDWIEIASRGGDRGFILAQDLVPETEWSAR